MLTNDKNELLTRVGPGTPMHDFFSRYWMPALLSSDLPASDRDPLRFTLLGQTFVAFRDGDGRVGVLDEGCLHRCASLSLGRVENDGLRCIFHGWKFSVDGALLDTPNVADPNFKTRLRATAYPVREAGDLIWVYLGPRELEPPFREYEYMRLPPEHRMVMRLNLDCSYLQILEGGLDSSHVGILHSDMAHTSDETSSDKLHDHLKHTRKEVLKDLTPTLEVRDTEFGFHYGASRATGDGTDNVRVRVTAYVAPSTVMIAPNLFVVHDIPYDDTHTGWIVTHWNPEKPVDHEGILRVMGLHTGGIWVNEHMDQSPNNGFQQNRAAMHNGSWSGLYGLGPEDAAINLSQGPILDRSKEHLVATDVACTRLRRLLLDSVARVQRGEDPVGLRPTSAGTIQAIVLTLPAGAPWHEHVTGNIEAAAVTA